MKGNAVGEAFRLRGHVADDCDSLPEPVDERIELHVIDHGRA